MASEYQSPQTPKFEPKLPDELMEQWHELDPVTKVLLRQQSILQQQTEWIMQRCTTGCPAVSYLPTLLQTLQKDIEDIKKLRDMLTAKWSVIAFLFVSLALPSLMLWLGRHL